MEENARKLQYEISKHKSSSYARTIKKNSKFYEILRTILDVDTNVFSGHAKFQPEKVCMTDYTEMT